MVNKSYVHIFTMNKKKVSKILEINTEDEMSAVLQVMCFFKNSAFYKKVTWYLVSGINKIERKNKIFGFTS